MSKGWELAQELGIECKQALYSAWGNFYSVITDFPCALFDEKGFLLVGSQDDLDIFGIKVTKRTNVPHHISSISGYQLLTAWRVSLPEELPPNIAPAEFVEGSVETITVNHYERDRKARSKCITHYGCVCVVCGIKLSDLYGAAADGFIHVHHIKPIASVKAEYQLDPVIDLRPLCPNCHAIVHLRREPYSIEEMQAIIGKRRTK